MEAELVSGTVGTYLVPVYICYATISIALTVWLARVLAKNGAVFLRDVFHDKPDLADAVNRLLVVGFYLVNLGYAALLLRADPAANVIGAIETLAWKLGLLLMSLAAMHFMNMFVFHRIRQRAIDGQAPCPPAGFGGGSAWQVASQHSAFELNSAIELNKARAKMAEGATT
jgi:hypothetical protein